LPHGALEYERLPILMLLVSMAGKNLINGEFRLLASIRSRLRSDSMGGRISLVGSCKLACCPQRTCAASHPLGHGVRSLWRWGVSTGAQRLWSSKFALFRNIGFDYESASPDKVAARGMGP
jgi:hypothetical protein